VNGVLYSPYSTTVQRASKTKKKKSDVAVQLSRSRAFTRDTRAISNRSGEDSQVEVASYALHALIGGGDAVRDDRSSFTALSPSTCQSQE